MPVPGPELDAARLVVVERGRERAAFAHLTNDAFLTLPFEALGPVKKLLRRFFSAEPWGPAEVEALAAAVGPGEGTWRRELDGDITMTYGWTDTGFGVDLLLAPGAAVAAGPEEALAASFEGPVVPEATPNPRSIRFRLDTPVSKGRRRWYESAAAVEGDAGVARLFSEFEAIANVLVGPDFVAVSLRRPSDWEPLLLPILALVTEEFGPGPAGAPATAAAAAAGGRAAGPDGAGRSRSHHRNSRLDEAWAALGSLRPADPFDLETVLAAAGDEDPFRRQVAARLLAEADPPAALAAWSRLVRDPARSVRRATVDAMVDAGREELRPLLEAALADADAWIRWKAVRGLIELGPGPSQRLIRERGDDPDFRVRLEVAAALRAG